MRLFRFPGRHDLFAASQSVKQAELLLGALAGYVDLNVGAEDAVVFDGLGSAHKLPRSLEAGQRSFHISARLRRC